MLTASLNNIAGSACAASDEPMEERLQLEPVTLREAFAFVKQYHRHHAPPQGGICAIAAGTGEKICGVAILGRPVSRLLQNGYTCEITRNCTDGTRNAASFLYRAAWRLAVALGYRRMVTYTLPEESGASLRAAGFRLLGEAGGGSWSRKDRPRIDLHPTQKKLRWELEREEQETRAND